MKLYRPLAVTAAAITLSFALTGCFGNPLESLAENGIEQIVEQSTGTDVEIDTNGTGASLPATFPADIPVVDGRIISALSVENSWSVTISVDSIDTAKAGYADLLATGFTETATVDLGEGNMINALDSDTYAVSYSWTVDSDGGVVVTYGVGLKE